MLARLNYFFLPYSSNNQKAKILHHSSLSSLIGLFLIFQLALSSILIAKPAVLGFASQISPERVIELTNAERAKVGAPPLKLNSLLNEAALRKAGDMFAFNYWAHNSPSGRDPWSFFKETGYNYLYAGENLARDFATPEAAISAWMASSTHKENIVNPKYQEIGIAVVDGTLGGVETTLVVQLFGTPVQPAVASKPQVPAPVPGEIGEKGITEIAEAYTGGISLARATGEEHPVANPFSLTKTIGIFLFGLLSGALMVDFVLVARRKTVRLSGRSLAHALFLLAMILLISLTRQGAIL